MRYKIKILEVKSNEEIVGTLRLDLNGTLKVSKINLPEEYQKAMMLNPKGNYILSGVGGYCSTLEKELNKTFPERNITIKEKKIKPELEKLLDRFHSRRKK